jgi:hypothetical protein
MAVKSAGPFSVRRLRPRRQLDAEADRYTVEYVGPYDTLEAQTPEIGASLTGFPSTYLVESAELEPTRATAGRLRVQIMQRTTGGTGSDDPTELSDPIYELDWGEERRPIEEHRKCGYLKADRPRYLYPERGSDSEGQETYTSSEAKGAPRTWEHWAALDSSDYTGGTWSLAQYKSIKEAGYLDYPVPFPIARVTRYARYRISPTGSVHHLSSPPSGCGAPSGWTYVKTAARSQKQGRLYTLIEEWRGYDRADDLFFL